MAAGDRNKNGTPKDIVRHYQLNGSTITACKRKNPGYSTEDWNDVDCKACLTAKAKFQYKKLHGLI